MALRTWLASSSGSFRSSGKANLDSGSSFLSSVSSECELTSFAGRRVLVAFTLDVLFGALVALATFFTFFVFVTFAALEDFFTFATLALFFALAVFALFFTFLALATFDDFFAFVDFLDFFVGIFKPPLDVSWSKNFGRSNCAAPHGPPSLDARHCGHRGS